MVVVGDPGANLEQQATSPSASVTLGRSWGWTRRCPAIGVALGPRLGQLGMLGPGVLDVEVHHQVVSDVQGTQDAAVPEEPFEAFQLLGDDASEVYRWCRAQALGVGHGGEAHGGMDLPVERRTSSGTEQAGERLWQT